MKKDLLESLAKAIASASGLTLQVTTSLLERPKNVQFGDVAFPCFSLSKEWKISPPECAKKLQNSITLPGEIHSAVVSGPFLNFSFNRKKFVENTLHDSLQEKPPYVRESQQKVIVEYSSPNIAKPFHVGHLRATLIGSALDRVYRALGHKVTSINHLGDWGTQFGFVWAGCKLWGKPKEETVTALVELYRRATKLKEEQEKGVVTTPGGPYADVNEMARNFFIDLEKGETYANDFWKWCVEISLLYLKSTYQRLNVNFDYYTGESFYSDKLESVKSDLESAGLLKLSQGAYGVELEEELGFARILTPDGRSLYLTRDLATAKYRAETFHFDKAIYVVGAPQALHFKQIIAILKALKRDYAEKILHVPFGHVLGMKTRGEGEFIELNDFLDEAYTRSLEAYHQEVTKRPEGLNEAAVAKAVALSAIIFSTLSVSNAKDVHFSWKHALEFQGDSGPYLLYAYARINSIKEKAKEAGLTSLPTINGEHLSDDTAYALVYHLSDLPEVVQKTTKDNEPSHLANYALQLARSFSKAYNELKVLGAPEEIAIARLSLFDCVGKTLRTTLELLGMEVLERM